MKKHTEDVPKSKQEISKEQSELIDAIIALSTSPYATQVLIDAFQNSIEEYLFSLYKESEKI